MITTALSLSLGMKATSEKLLAISKPTKNASQSSISSSLKIVMFVQTGSFDETSKVVTTSAKSTSGVAIDGQLRISGLKMCIADAIQVHLCHTLPEVVPPLIVLTLITIFLWSKPKLTPIQTSASLPSVTVTTVRKGLSCSSENQKK